MKNTLPRFALLMIAAVFAACSNVKKQNARQHVEVLTRYVDSIEAAPASVYTRTNWEEIESGYNERIARIDAAMSEMDITEKERAEAIKAKFAAIKAGYEIKLKESEVSLLPTEDYKLKLRNNLFSDGKVTSDLNFDFVTAQNAVSVYENFVNTVISNKDIYTRADWDEIKVLSEALEARRSIIEKDLSTADRLKIAELKVKFHTIKATNREIAITNEEKKEQ